MTVEMYALHVYVYGAGGKEAGRQSVSQIYLTFC